MDRSDILRIAAECGLDPRTISKHMDGKRVNPASAIVIDAAVKKLKIKR